MTFKITLFALPMYTAEVAVTQGTAYGSTSRRWSSSPSVLILGKGFIRGDFLSPLKVASRLNSPRAISSKRGIAGVLEREIDQHFLMRVKSHTTKLHSGLLPN